MQGHKDEAVKELQTALRIDPNSAQTRNVLNAILSGPKYSPQDALRQKQRTELTSDICKITEQARVAHQATVLPGQQSP
jgi:hypothetical protein